MHAYSQQHPSVNWRIAVADLHLTLDLHCALHGFNHAIEFNQDRIANALYESATMPFDRGRDEFGLVRLKRGKCAGFIRAHEPTIAGHVGRKDRGQSTSHSAPRS